MTAPASTSQPLVSVVIASHRPQYLSGLLKALCDQSMDRSRYEIVAVCDYPVETLQKQFSEVLFQSIDDRSISRKRNAGVGKARAAIVAFIDDDCIPSRDWLEQGYGYLSAHSAAAAVEGLTSIASPENVMPALREYRRLESFGYRTNNLFCRRAVFQEAGGFDERFTVQREDLDFCFTLLDRNHEIHTSERINVTHRFRAGEPWDLLKNCLNRRFDPLLYKKHSRRYRDHVRSPFPPSLFLLLVLYPVAGLSILSGTVAFLIGCTVVVFAVSASAIRRCGVRGPVTMFAIEWVSCLVAPLALFGALLHGSIRFRRLLIL
ncbi:MAG: glycosyltransferase [Chitinispirillaceae bacterium]|nr:glycosyltransferase [Chitinispirillaceae bacterium]